MFKSRFSVLLALVATALIAGGSTGAIGRIFRHAPAVPPPPASPTSASQIQNLDQVKTAIKAYYGDTVSSVPDPVNGTQMLHFASPTSAYAHEMAGIEQVAERYLARRTHVANTPGHVRRQSHAANHRPSATGKPAIVLDVDDTSLNTYDYEIWSNFVYSPTSNATFVNAAAFPAVFGMPDLAKAATSEGYTLFFLTGRPVSQIGGTRTNLLNAGFPAVPDSQLFLKDTSASWLSSCGGSSCTTTQYKSLTRQHIESLGYHIVANFGDQFSDLRGGFADRDFKLPNPMYFLP